jgi:transposase
VNWKNISGGAYNAIDADKQRCWVHLLRELRELKAMYSQNMEIKAFSKKMKRFLERGKELQSKYQDGTDVDKPLARIKNDTSRWADTKHRHQELKRLAKRLHRFRGELYTFVKTGVDPTNNFGEREIRPAVLMRKTSYCNRSAEGAQTQSILMTVARTARKQRADFVETTTEYLQTTH